MDHDHDVDSILDRIREDLTRVKKLEPAPVTAEPPKPPGSVVQSTFRRMLDRVRKRLGNGDSSVGK